MPADLSARSWPLAQAALTPRAVLRGLLFESAKVLLSRSPEAIASAVKQHAPHAVRIGLESGQLSSWLFHGLKVAVGRDATGDDIGAINRAAARREA
jgi:hypothetical protein